MPSVSSTRNKTHKKTIIIGASIAGLLVAVVGAYVGRGCDEYTWSIIIACTGVGAPALLLAWIVYMVSKRPTRVVAKLIAVACFVLLQSIGLIIGKQLYATDVRQAKQFCESLIPAIEDVKKKYGRYPPKLDKLIPAGKNFPRLIKNQGETFYWGTPRTYGFSFDNPQKWLQVDKLCYTNERKEWHSCPGEPSKL